ncbi:hypothetical protein HZS_1543, partial [Henneguya salminicola]
MANNPVWIKLNVGGKVFLTTRETLKSDPRSKLARMLDDQETSKDENGHILMDRDPDFFKIILRYLRTKHLLIPKYMTVESVLDEALYLGLGNMVTALTGLKGKKKKDEQCRTYRIMSMSLQDLSITLGEMSEGWRFEQLIKSGSSPQPEEYLCIISQKSPGTPNHVEIPE